MKLNNYDLSQKIYSSSYIHAITPFFWQEMIPSDVFNLKNRYIVNFNPAIGQTLAGFNINIMFCFVPYSQLWTDFTKFYNGAGITVPQRAYDININTDKDKIWYYILPYYNVGEKIVDFCMLNPRAYQKIFYDVFARKLLKVGNLDVDPEDFYVRTSGADATTTTDLRYAPFNSDYYNEIVNEIRYGVTATEINSPFDWDDLKSALMTDNFAVMRRKFGVRMQDWINKVYGITELPKEDVEIVSFHSQELDNNDIVNTDTNQGKLITKTFGITPKIDFKYRAKEFGVLMGVYYVTSNDTPYSQGIPHELTAQNLSTYYGFHHPEVEGLAYENIAEQNINVYSTSPTSTIGYTEIYSKYRKAYSKALSEFARESVRGNDIPHIPVSQDAHTFLNVYFPDETTFDNLFPDAGHQFTFMADVNIDALRPVAKVFSESEITRSFNQPIIL